MNDDVYESLKDDYVKAWFIDWDRSNKFYGTDTFRNWENTNDGSKELWDDHTCMNLPKDSPMLKLDPYFCKWG